MDGARRIPGTGFLSCRQIPANQLPVLVSRSSTFVHGEANPAPRPFQQVPVIFEIAPVGKMAVNGGEEEQVLPSVHWRALSLVRDGIYFIPEPSADRKYFVQFLSFATGKVTTVIPLSAPASEELSVSPDGRFLLFSQTDQRGSDLMLVENFR